MLWMPCSNLKLLRVDSVDSPVLLRAKWWPHNVHESGLGLVSCYLCCYIVQDLSFNLKKKNNSNNNVDNF